MYWGTSMPTSPTDVAGRRGRWWKERGTGGVRRPRAYVEKVVSGDEVIVSQDSWGGDFVGVITRPAATGPAGSSTSTTAT